VTVYIVTANTATLTVVDCADEQAARDAGAMVAGYRNEAHMVASIEQPSELRARELTAENAEDQLAHVTKSVDQDWERGATEYTLQWGDRVLVSGPQVIFRPSGA